MFLRTCPITFVLAAGLVACSSHPPTIPGVEEDVASITLSATSLNFAALGQSEVLVPTFRDADGAILSGVKPAWSHRVNGVVTVDATGKVTSAGNGADTVVVTAGLVTTTAIVVVQQVPADISLASSVTNFQIVGTQTQIAGKLLDGNDREIAGGEFAWASSNPLVLSIDGTGKATATGPGSAVITASSGSLSTNLSLMVNIVGPVGGPVLGGAITCDGSFAGAFPCSGIDLVAYLPLGALGVNPGFELNDIWGWTDTTNARDYVIVGRTDGVAFVDVTVPEQPRYLGFLPIPTGASPNFWHDVKVYKNHAFIVADGAGPHGMQVFDLTRLGQPSAVPRTFTADFVYDGVRSAHNIVIDEETGFAYITGASSGGNTCGGGLHMVNIQMPESPTFAGCFADPLTGRAGTGYTHDAQCVVYGGPDASYTGQEICFNANETHLSIADVSNKSAPVAISRASYPSVAYAHQLWLSEDQNYLYLNDELDDGATATTRTLIWDVSDLEDPILVTQYLGPTGATDHNNYVVGSTLFASNYQFGIRFIDISDPVNPSQVGYFDTAPELANSSGYGGSWSNYPFFASGIVVVTSSEEGLFILRRQ